MLKTRFGFHVETTDLEDAVHGNIGRRMKNFEISMKSCDLNNESLPWDDSTFDIVIFSEVMEHLLISPLSPLMEMARVLKNGGYLIITTPNAASFAHIVFLLSGRHFMPELEDTVMTADPDIGHIREYTLNEIKTLVTNAGLKIDKVMMSRYQDNHVLDTKYSLTSKPVLFISRNLLAVSNYTTTLLFPRFRSTIMIRAKKT